MSDTPKNHQEIADRQYKEIVSQGLDHMSQAANEINSFVASRQRRIPEPFFVKQLLPIIRAHVRGDDNVELGIWLNVADGMNNTIEVVDENQQHLFIVPPAFSKLPERDVRPPEGKRFTTIGHLVGAQADMLENGDMRGSMVVDSELSELCAARPEDGEKTKDLLLLVEIYDRYDLPLNELLGSAADEIAAALKQRKGKSNDQQSSASNKQSSENELDEDDLIY